MWQDNISQQQSAKTQEVIVVDSSRVSCSGPADADSRHPKIYLSVATGTITTCPYCGKLYTKQN
jgi:uncharacterized Zn-finger protein